LADEIEYKFNSTFNNQLKYTQSSEPSVMKIHAILDILGIRYEAETKSIHQTDYYFDTLDYAILRNKNSLRIRDIENGQLEITSKHFISHDTDGQYHRMEDNEIIYRNGDRLESLLKNGKKYFPGMDIKENPILIINNNRTSFGIKTEISDYILSLDKFHFQNTENEVKSDDFYEIEVEKNSKQNDGKQKDPQLNKLSVAFRDIFGFSNTEKNKYAKGVDWLENPINTKKMQFILFDVVDYSLSKSVEQKTIIKAFTQIITDVLVECPENNCLKIPIGDGVILCLRENYDKTLKIIQGVMGRTKTYNKENLHSQFNLRCAINYGLVLEYQDINSRSNLAGLGINNASRILSKSKKNQIMVSDDFFKYFYDLGMIPKKFIRSNSFSEPFTINVKHNQIINVRNFYIPEEDIGIPHSIGVTHP